MTKADLITVVAQKTNLSKKDSDKAVAAVLDAITEALASGEKRCDVARGAHRAVARRVAGMYNRVNGLEPVVMTGGVALNSDMVRCLSEELKTTVIPVEHPQIAGAIGAAVFAYEKYHK